MSGRVRSIARAAARSIAPSGLARARACAWVCLWACLWACACASPGLDSGPGGGDRLTVTRGTLAERLLLTGELEAIESERLSTPRTRLWNLTIRWLADEGSRVKAGDRVLEYDNSQLVSQLEEARLALQQADNGLAKQRAENQLARAEKRFAVTRARIQFEKAKIEAGVPADLYPTRLYQEKQLALEQARSALAQAEEEAAAQETSAALAERIKGIEFDNARREIASAERELEALVLRAPRDGILLVERHPWEARKFQVGDTTWPGFTVAKLPDLSAMQVTAALSDVDDGSLTPGTAARCVLDAYPDEPVPCTVAEISPVAHKAIDDELRRSFQVRVALAETDPERMLPGMSVKVDIPLGGGGGPALLVPRAAVDFTSDPPRVRRADGALVDIVPERCDALSCQIPDDAAPGGLDAGTEVLARGAW